MPRWTFLAAATSAAAALLACSGPFATATPSLTPANRAADLRTRLDGLLGEHVELAAKATSAQLGGRADELTAYGALVAQNGADIADVISAGAGADTGTRFAAAWATHDSHVSEYTAAVAKHDQDGMARAVTALTTQSVPELAQVLTAAGVNRGTAMTLVTEHVAGIQQVVNDEAYQDWPSAYADTHKAYAHMAMLGDALAAAFIKKQPARYPGQASGQAADLRVALNSLLQEHAYLVTDTTDAALGGRLAEFQAATRALDSSTGDLSHAIGGVYGSGPEGQLAQDWSAHDGLLVDYAVDAVRRDQASETRALSDLRRTSGPRLADFLAGTTGAPQATLATVLQEQTAMSETVVDAQSAHDPKNAAVRDRTAAEKMATLATPLATAMAPHLH